MVIIFFNELDTWFSEFDFKKDAPRTEEIIKGSMILGITLNPAFEVLKDYPRYKSMLETLRSSLGGHNDVGLIKE